MSRINLIRRSFVRQLDRNDCGLACLSMILNFSGRKEAVSEFRSNVIKNEEGASLLDLRNFAINLNIQARCVEMELSFLTNLKSPCILHMVNGNGDDHFQVCYGSIKKGKNNIYLMADPATYVYYLPEKELDDLWVSKAALYFDDLKEDLNSFEKSAWISLFSTEFLPKAVWIIIPALSVSTAFLGIGISWFLQRGLSNSILYKKEAIAVVIIILLLIISLFKSLFSFLRHYIIMTVNLAVAQNLMKGFITKMTSVSTDNKGAHYRQPAIRNSIADIQKIQNAVSIFVGTFLSDGALLILMLSAIFYEYPLAGIINLCYLGIVGYLNIRSLPGIAYNNAQIIESFGTTEVFLTRGLNNLQFKLEKNNQWKNLTTGHQRYILLARSFGIKIGRLALFYECLGTINVIIVLSLSIDKVQEDAIEYSSFMVIIILSYFLTTLVPKIGNGLWIFSEGANACLQFNSNSSNLQSV